MISYIHDGWDYGNPSTNWDKWKLSVPCDCKSMKDVTNQSWNEPSFDASKKNNEPILCIENWFVLRLVRYSFFCLLCVVVVFVFIVDNTPRLVNMLRRLF